MGWKTVIIGSESKVSLSLNKLKITIGNEFQNVPLGDIVFFGPNGGTHTGIVVKSDANNVYTIEGNTSDMVAERTRPRATGYVYGYGTPAY